MTLYAGIDPGAKGALAVLHSSGEIIALHDLQLIEDRSIKFVDGQALSSAILEAKGGQPLMVAVERVSSMPRQGVASTFKFGTNFGSILGALRVMQLPIKLITPGTWKQHYGLISDKKAALNKARMMYPDAELHLEKHEGRAEALLLANYFREISK